MNALQSLDQSIVIGLNTWVAGTPLLGTVVTQLAVYGVYLIPVSWLIWWFLAGQKQRLYLFSSLFAGILAWHGLNRIFKVFYFQQRPSQDLPIQELLFERPENSFPSDHAAFLSGVAFFFLLEKQGKSGVILLVLALVASFARVAVAVHYPTDILGGFVSGFLAAWITKHLHPWLAANVWTRLLGLARLLHLA